MRIHERIKVSEPAPGIRLFTVPTALKGITHIAGSLLGGDVYSPANHCALPGVVADMLDEGTRRHSKHALAERLEGVGASLAFSAASHHVRFSGIARPQDSALLIETLAEELRESAFKARAFASVIKRIVGTLDAGAEDTDEQATIRLSRLLFPEGHPNAHHTTDEVRRDVASLRATDARAFHSRAYGIGSLTLVAAGDVDAEALEKSLRESFGGWKRSALALEAPKHRATLPSRGVRETVFIPEKASVSLRVGAPLGISATHEDFYPLLAGLSILGGLPLISRLFQSVRERLGLTYAIGASIEGAYFRSDGYWLVRASFAPEALAAGKQAIERELERFAARGVSARELTEFKDAVLGGHVVGLASAHQLSAAILSTIEKERPLAYLDNYLDIIRGLTLRDVSSAIKRYVNPDRASWVAAGTVSGDEWAAQ
jgi:zinc protease